jgi:APA family basic amino acid/polyamine antiporter
MVGSGVFLLPASLAKAAGPISILGWLFTGAGAMLLALVFAKLGRTLPRTGGPYAYARSAFGDFIGFQTAWGYWIAVWAGNAAIAIAFVGYAAVFWNRLANDNLLAAAVGIGAIWLLTLTNVLGVREGGRVQLVTTVLKFLPLLAIGVVGLFFLESDNFSPFAPHGGVTHGVNAAATLTLWAFIGLESATVPAEEIRDPERTIPRATILGTIAATVVYVVATVAVFGVVPTHELAKSTSPFADAAAAIFGGNWSKAVAAVAMISTFGALNGWILLQGRVPLAAAEDGVFPKRFARVHGTRRTPVFGLVVSSVLLTVLMLMNYNASLVDQFNQVILLATLTTLVPYAYAAAAELQLFVSDRELFSGTRFGLHAAIALLAFAYSAWAIWGAGKDVIAKGFMLLVVGIPVYVYIKWRQSGAARPAMAPAVARQRVRTERRGERSGVR